MIKNNTTPAPSFILNKLDALYSLLVDKKHQLEHLATLTCQIEYKQTVASLAQELNQYAVEILSQFECLGGGTRKPDLNSHLEHHTDSSPAQHKPMLEASIENIIVLCRNHEQQIIDTYKDYLNESISFTSLRKLLRTQLNGILCSFLKLKMLQSTSSSRWNDPCLLL